jgi:Cep192 domain 4/HYDIN/CFA65/VesB-like, Ig-like domain/Lactonase, 7-bladed beta-propeller
LPRVLFQSRIRRPALCAWLFIAAVGTCPQSWAQTTQHVYASEKPTTTLSVLPAYNKDTQTGALTAISGSPFTERFEGGYLAIDGQGRFLFVLNPQSDAISMFQINQSSGALTEVPNSPFGAARTINPNNAPSNPVSIATESSGKYLYVGYASGNVPPNAAITPYSIDSTNLQLVLTPQLSFDITGTPLQMFSDPKGLRLYVGLGPNPLAGYTGADTTVYSIDATSGVLFPLGSAGGGNTTGRCIAMDPQGQFFYEGSGQFSGLIEGGILSPVDGTGGNSFTLDLGANNLPTAMLIDSSGKYLYVQETSGLFIYSINSTSGQLTQVLGPLANATINRGTGVADPLGPFLYSLDQNGIHVFQVDSATGNLTEIAGSPYSINPGTAVGGAGLAVTGAPIQAVTGPVAQLFPATTDFGQVTIGQTSATRIVSLANTGDQTLAINGISITGTNAGDFSQTNTCAATLAPNANCSISLSFAPSVSGTEQATLQVTDNAPGSPQSAAVTGTGVPGRGAVTLVPGTVDFGTVAQGAPPASQAITLTNSGTAALSISALALGGANAGDFSQTNNCAGTSLPVQTSCTINATFSPQAQGQRSATITVTDDAADSPQTITLTGNAASPFQLGAGSSGTTSATVSAGQTAQFSLQLTPGPGYTGSVALACSGAPLGAACTVTPAALAVSSASALPFIVAVTTSGSAATPTFERPQQLLPFRGWPAGTIALLCVVLLFCLWLLEKKRGRILSGKRLVLRSAFGIVVVLLLASVSGCGGGSNASPPAPQAPQPVVTPSGTSTIAVTATSGNLPPQTIALTLTVR